ncbi:hypothetical protein GCM10008018_66250 [Paenibacillus marchantiophytorum]|uniref:Swt1-like HEPN domain-containing protein n=1 Tax=Paenibacillus marchantiophytorum TaxID=1619310 RepID=A0ABQ1FHD3_9BACL|nr:hypothetical protein [Paenibacillus marchantiophytorum]GGA11920.1 hypothetical protein GCM10008018_66250 [Paenibacillus marchantiophytorum]
MKLRIEKWVEETNPFGDSAYELFEESVRCYKIGAYKSAFIMSYLSFKTTIKYRILGCSYGGELVRKNPKFWELEIIKNLDNDDYWEKFVNEIIDASCANKKIKEDIAILHFKNEEQIKTDYNYWKNIRNDCAHAKRQITIDSSTVECFWNYMIDNLSKFYVLGGEEYLLRELKNLYEFFRYPDIIEHEKVTHLIDDVNVIYKKNSKEFFVKLFQKIRKSANGYLVIDSNLNFWKAILESDYNDVKNGLVEVISNDAQYFFNFYNYFPQLLEMSYSLNSKFIIEELSYWLKEYSVYNSGKTFWVILLEILDKHSKHVNIDKIVSKRNIEMLKSFEPDERTLRILNSYYVFKKYILEVSSWFFKTDSESQYDNFSNYSSKDYENIEICFDYLEWDIECIKAINDALCNLKSSMAFRTNYNAIWNGRDFADKCSRIICNNKNKIEKIQDINLTDYSYVWEILSNSINKK